MTLRRRRPGLVYPVWEDWHYVGGTDEPAFQNSWANISGSMRLGFRIRETGMVDIQGRINGGTTTSVVFTLPVGYRPDVASWLPAIGLAVTGDLDTPVLMGVGTNGEVRASNVTTTCDSVWISGQFFLDSPPTAA